jgi:hypothetical protein
LKLDLALLCDSSVEYFTAVLVAFHPIRLPGFDSSDISREVRAARVAPDS